MHDSEWFLSVCVQAGFSAFFNSYVDWNPKVKTKAIFDTFHNKNKCHVEPVENTVSI